MERVTMPTSLTSLSDIAWKNLMSTRKPVISVIGSCRVHNSMRAMRNAALIHLNNSRLTEFCHAPREVLQKIRIANNRLSPPSPELSLLINGVDQSTAPQKRADFRTTDVFLIEISSVRRLTLSGMELQLNFVTDFFVKPYGLDDWLSQLSEKARNVPQGTRVRQALSAGNSHIPDHVIEMAAAIEMTMEPDSVISEMVKRIVNYLQRPIVFAGHFNVRKDNGQWIGDRVRLNRCLKMAAIQYGAGYFEPANIIDAAGQDVALRDNNHWAYDFESDAGKFILDNHILPML